VLVDFSAYAKKHQHYREDHPKLEKESRIRMWEHIATSYSVLLQGIYKRQNPPPKKW